MSIVNPVSLYGLVVGFASDAQFMLSVLCSILYVVPFVNSVQVIDIDVLLVAVAVVASDPQGNGRFQIADAAGNVVSEMLMLPDIGGGIIVNSTTGKKMGVLAATEKGGRLNLLNARGVPVFIASTTSESGGGAMTVTNQRGIPVVIMKSDEEHLGIIKVLDADGDGARTVRPLRGYSP